MASGPITYDTLNRAYALNRHDGRAAPYQLNADRRLHPGHRAEGRTVNWTYDGIYRLSSETIAYDPRKKTAASAMTLTRSVIGSRRLHLFHRHPFRGWTFNPDDEISSETYDANGNVTSTGGKIFTYDSENHLVSMSASGTSATYCLRRLRQSRREDGEWSHDEVSCRRRREPDRLPAGLGRD